MGDKVIVSIVKGGLGNQLFIYAASRALALRNGRSLFLDTKLGYQTDSYERSYRLNRFPINALEAPDAWMIAPTLRHPKHKSIRALSKLLPRNWRPYIAERRHLPPTQLLDLNPIPDRVTLLGYWQDEAYFAGQADVIRRELTPDPPQNQMILEAGRSMAGKNSVFIHFRRHRFPHVLEMDYYQRAIDDAHSRIHNPSFFLFGEDLEACRENLNFHGNPAETTDGLADNELDDLWLMGQCRHGITANSSFSWWAAWLGDPHKSKHIWAPQNSGYELNAAPHWIALPNRLTRG